MRRGRLSRGEALFRCARSRPAATPCALPGGRASELWHPPRQRLAACRRAREELCGHRGADLALAHLVRDDLWVALRQVAVLAPRARREPRALAAVDEVEAQLRPLARVRRDARLGWREARLQRGGRQLALAHLVRDHVRVVGLQVAVPADLPAVEAGAYARIRKLEADRVVAGAAVGRRVGVTALDHRDPRARPLRNQRNGRCLGDG